MKNSSQLAESKLIIMYMLHKINLPMSLSYIQEFALASEYMDYFSLSKYLSELTESEYIIKNIEHNKTTYTISKKGYKTLNLFENLIPNSIKQKINEYVAINKNQIKKDLDIVANFTENNNEYTVKCAVYEDKKPLIELSLKVASKRYANTICDNWKKDASKYYLSFMKTLLNSDEK
ncbi:DUF4364 family protein [uncultured Tyzzerella sp.]|uniref:DUF4364 family protein n=1 Tax=uncultured Tyzzerella sp. TaxID=2321398 RepID=UPI002943306A|nr:DUF4364 family protein [uncultured Tyzzerella sp.]